MNRIAKTYKNNRQIIHYLIAGCLTTAVSLSVYYVLTATVFDPGSGLQIQITNLISWIAAVTFSYYVNRRYVFESKEGRILKELKSFYISRISTLMLDMFIMFVFVTRLGINDRFVKLLVQVIVTVMNYILSKWLVFRRRDL